MTFLTKPTVPNEQAIQLPAELARSLIHTVTGQRTGAAMVRMCRFATTTNLTLTAVSTTIDTSGTIVEGDRILVKDQSTHSQNGIYVAGKVTAGSCAFARATDFNTADMVQTGCVVTVAEGTAAAGTFWSMSTAGWPGAKVVGTDTLDFSSYTTTTYGAATATTAGTQSAANFNGQKFGQDFVVRGVCSANVAALATFTVTQDGITYVAGDVVLLTKQTTAAQNGPYVVGTVSGTAPLTRPNWWAAASTFMSGAVFEVGFEGTLWGGSRWKATAAAGTIDTNDPVFYPQNVKGVATLSAGVYSLGATEGLYLKSTTKSSISLTQCTAGGTVTTTVRYGSKVADNTAGIIGTAVVKISALTSDGATVNTSDTSTVFYQISNW
jgi:hypothetical protein